MMKLNERLVYVRPDGSQYPLHAPPSRVVMSEEGFGTPPMEYVVDTAPFQHGDSVRALYLLPRPVQLTVLQNFCSREDYWSGRAALLNAIRPNRITDFNTPGKLRYYLPGGIRRQLDVMLDAGPGFAPPTGGWREWSFTEVLRFVAHDPVWYDPTLRTVTVSGAASEELEFPITFPIEFNSFGLAQDVTYLGTWEEYPSFTVVGPITGLQIVNGTTDQQIGLNYALPSGYSLTITLRGEKTIERSDGLNLLNYLTEDSDLATFSLKPDPEATDGVNTITVYGSDTDGSTEVSMQYYNRYFGI
jgi:hypothetical protein